MAKQFFVYMTASKRNGTLYVGVTSDLPARAWQHNNKVTDGFTAKYNVINWCSLSLTNGQSLPAEGAPD